LDKGLPIRFTDEKEVGVKDAGEKDAGNREANRLNPKLSIDL
jgi:hypothetical protein